MSRKILFIGEAPGRTSSERDLALEGASGRRLARLMEVRDIREVAEAHNLLQKWPGARGPKGALLPAHEARVAANGVMRALKGRVYKRRYLAIVMLGGRVARAFRLQKAPQFSRIEGLDPPTFVMPHPSGVSHWWSCPQNRKQAAEFLKSLARVVKEEAS